MKPARIKGRPKKSNLSQWLGLAVTILILGVSGTALWWFFVAQAPSPKPVVKIGPPPAAAIPPPVAKPPAALDQLLAGLKEKDWHARAQAAAELGGRKEAQAAAPLLALLRDEDRDAAAAVEKALIAIGKPTVAGLIEELKNDRLTMQAEPGLTGACKVLAGMGPEVVESVLPLLKDSDYRVRANAAKVLGALGDARAAGPLCAALQDEIWRVRINARWALEKIGKGALEPLETTLTSGAREQAAMALGAIGDPQAQPALAKAVAEDKDTETKIAAVWALGELKNRASIDVLLPLLDGQPPNRLKAGVFAALRKLAGADAGNTSEQWQAWRKANPL
jgi:HEAT repeat protein